MRSAAARISMLLIFQAALLLRPAAVQAQQEPFSRAVNPDWEGGFLIVETRTAVQPGESRPDLRHQIQRRIERQLPALIVEEVLPLTLDSYETIGDRLQREQQLFRALNEAAAAGVEEQAAGFSRDLGEIHLRYRLPFYGPHGLASVFVSHIRPFPMQLVLGFVPARPFTGLVIYATGELPAHGKPARERVQPALFPRLFDQELNLVLSAEMCDPEALRRGGLAAYRYGEETAADIERVGAFPLRTVARGVFGKNSTDLLLSGEAVRQLLSLEANRAMLRNCRILIVLDAPDPR